MRRPPTPTPTLLTMPVTDSGDAAATSRTSSTIASADWIEHLSTAGLPEPGSDPLASPVKLSPLATEPIDHFELIWPSGDIDEQFGAETDEPFPHPDIDRAGVTARLVGRRTRHRGRAGGSAGNVDVDDDVDVDVDDVDRRRHARGVARRRGRPGGDHRRRGARRASCRRFDRHRFARRPPPARRAVGRARPPTRRSAPAR